MSADLMPRQEEISTRREIINLLRVVGPMTVGELGERLHITHVAVRRHLTSLERDGLVTSVQQRLPMGRPTRVYSLTEAADNLFPKKYGALAVELLDFLAEVNPAMVESFFAHRGRALVERYAGQVTGESMAERVEQLTAVQQANGYLAECEQGEGGVVFLKEYNCPVHQVSRRYPHACAHELDFFKAVLGTENVERVECIARGGQCCRYRIGP
ncbi:MAG: metalloregulator ArsR/SmtB family transcription factor [Symbiobacterium sp.]|uniref:helix-turn-helix transcriptional regulator n=1 Tax=Symbiobacterium sp. TaxID=1971213 RepID=UPI00346436C0